jgi:hypothetical protein
VPVIHTEEEWEIARECYRASKQQPASSGAGLTGTGDKTADGTSSGQDG